MKQLIIIACALPMLSGCAWIAANPQLDAEAVGLVEQGIEDVVSYETKTLSPAPPQGANGP